MAWALGKSINFLFKRNENLFFLIKVLNGGMVSGYEVRMSIMLHAYGRPYTWAYGRKLGAWVYGIGFIQDFQDIDTYAWVQWVGMAWVQGRDQYVQNTSI